MILYAITAVYFAGVMVRLMLTLTPVVCILSGIVFAHTYERYLFDETATKQTAKEVCDLAILLCLFLCNNSLLCLRIAKGKEQTQWIRIKKKTKKLEIGSYTTR